LSTLFIADVFFPDTVGGAGRMARQLAEGLARVEPVTVVTRNPGGALPAHETVDGLNIHRFAVDRSRPLHFAVSALGNCARVVRRVRSAGRVERVVFNQPLSALAALPAVAGLPAFYNFYSPWSEEYRVQTEVQASGKRPRPWGAWLRRTLEGWLIRRSRRTLVMSDFMRRELHRLHAYPDDRVVLVPGGVDVERFHPASGASMRSRFGLPLEAEVLLTVRNLVPRMGLSNLVAAFELLAADRPALHLALAGDGPLRESLAELIAARGLGDRIHLLGRVPDQDLPGLYRCADLFVLPTEALEGFGLVTIEALASGTPVVATPVGASPEILRDLDPELVARSATAADIAAVISRFLRRPPEDRAELSARGRALCESRYSWRTVTDAFNRMVLAA
jgi:glycosyltransferase involved in cell wall biosynthesis